MITRYIARLFVLATLFLRLAIPVSGQCELAKLVASDPGSGDFFGYSVSTTGNLIVVGAWLNDDVDTDSGSAYVYRYNGTTWVVEQILTASDGEAQDYFGVTVSIDGDLVVVGSGDGGPIGSAYVYRYDGNTWVQEQKLMDTGIAVSVSKDVVVVGARNDDGVTTDSGSAYAYRYDGNTWAQEQKLTARDGANNDDFGVSVSLSGNVVVVGAPGHDAFLDFGAAYVYRYDGRTWVEEQKLTASDGAFADRFGISVSLREDTVVVGATGHDDNGERSGAAYVYRYDGGTWVEEQKLTASDGAPDDIFGSSVSLNKDTVVVGAPGDDDNGERSGSAYVYRYEGTIWVEEQKRNATDATSEDRFGSSVSVTGDLAVVGAHLATTTVFDSGASYLLDLGGSDCNGNGDADLCDIVFGSSTDLDTNLIPDDCEEFLRGDADANRNLNGLVDGLFVLSFQFVPGSPAPPCMDAADADDSGTVTGLVDGLYILNYFFLGGSPRPPAPGPDFCGSDPTLDSLRCEISPCR